MTAQTQQPQNQQAQAEDKKHWLIRTLTTLFASWMSVSLLTVGIILFLWFYNPKFGSEFFLTLGMVGIPTVIAIGVVITLTQFIVEKIREKRGMTALTNNWYEWMQKVANLIFKRGWTTALFIAGILWVMSLANYSLGFHATKAIANFFGNTVMPIVRIVLIGGFIYFLIKFVLKKYLGIGGTTKKKKSDGH